MNSQSEIRKEHDTQLVKYKYYMIALCIASIGYSIVRTTGRSIDCCDIPLAIAVSSWGISIFLGFRFLKCSLSILNIDYALIDVRNGVHPTSKNHPEKIKIGVDSLTDSINRFQRIGKNANVWQERLFYIGMIMFIFWHVLDIL